MIGNSFARLTGSKRNLLALMASSAVFTAGCANMATTASNPTPLGQAATLSGTIHGGNQQVVGATVNLYFSGLKGSGTPAVLAATTTTDNAGSFAFNKDATNGDPNTGNTFSCPTGFDPLVYVISTGGNTQNNGDSTQTNTAAAFISVYGNCLELTAANHVDMTEVTTVATMAAVQQFFNPVPASGIKNSIIFDGTGQQSNIVTQLPATIALLADPSAGTAVTSTTIAASGSNVDPSVSVTATPEPGKVNLLANILSACINGPNNATPACTTLFTSATPPNTAYTANFTTASFPQAIDTLQAIYYLLSNPTSGGSGNIGTIFGLAGGVSGPYQPALATQPTDWTIAISYASTNTCGSASGSFINSPIDINIDSADNVWIDNVQATGGGNLSEISGAGVPLTCVLQGTGSSLGGATVDNLGNVWTGSGTSLYRYSNGNTLAFPATVTPIGVTADGLGNIYFTAVNGGVGSLYQIPGGASATAAIAPIQISNTVGPNPVRLMPDYQKNGSNVTIQGNIFVTSGTTSVAEVSPSALPTAPGYLNGFVTSTIPTSGNSYGISLGPQNNLYVSAVDSGAITALTLSGGNYVPLGSFPFTTPGTIGIATPTSIAVDGRLNVWIPNNATGNTSVSELGSTNGAALGLSPSTGFQKDASYLTGGRALAVDQAGNVWVAGDGINFVTEIVGAGVPIFQPYSLGLQKGRFQTIP
jgi:hypothetical protein